MDLRQMLGGIDSKDGQAGNILEVLERRVGLEGLAERLPTRGTDAILLEAANTRTCSRQRVLTADV